MSDHTPDGLGQPGPTSMFSLDLDLGLDDLTGPEPLNWTTVAVDDVATPPVPPPPAPPAPLAAAPMTQPTPMPPQPSMRDEQVEALANDVVAALGAYEAAAETASPSSVALAADVLAEVERLQSSSAGPSEEIKAARWADVVSARAAYRKLLDGNATPSISVSAEALETAAEMQAELEDAEQKARRPMSGPGAFKKFAAARKALALHLAEFGVETHAELLDVAIASAGASPATLQDAAEAVAEAEAAWVAADQPAADGLPQTPEADGLRVRAYRVIGAVVDDGVLVERLRSIADGGQVLEQHRRRLTLALQALGLPADTDPIASARAIRTELHRH